MQNEKGHTTISPIPSEELYRFGADGNLQAYMYENLLYVHYGYNDANTRTYKYSFDLSPQWVNGRLEAVNFNLHNAMFYPNSYLNFNQDGYYTKHYYNGMERIASRLGDNNLLLATHDPELQDRKDQLDSNIRRNIADITGYEFLPVGEEQTIDAPKPIFELPVIGISNLQPSADGIYYYHPNHLGSTCYVTDENASVVQGFLYAPFGEITNEYNSSFGSSVLPKYSFNAKELDEETGMYYYEARYMAPPVFISRDPLFEKYPTISPYTYCANNPVKYVDPDGKKVRLSNNYVGGIENIAKIAATSYGSEIMNHLIKQKEVYNLNSTFLTIRSKFIPKTRDINYVGNPWKKTCDGGAFNSMIAMGHELFHAYDYSNRKFGSIITLYMINNYLEPRAISFENYLRESYSMLPLRERYGNIRGDFHQMHPEETISNFITLGHNSDKTSYGFRYTKTSKITKSFINIGGMSIPNEISEKTETFYMVVSMDKNNNVSFKTFNNFKEYKKEISNW